MTMDSAHITVEWVVKEIKLYWTYLDCKRHLRTGEGSVGSAYFGVELLSQNYETVYIITPYERILIENS